MTHRYTGELGKLVRACVSGWDGIVGARLWRRGNGVTVGKADIGGPERDSEDGSEEDGNGCGIE